MTISGVAPAEADLVAAHYDVEIACGRLIVDVDESVFNPVDAAWLTRAVAHQARFRTRNPHLFDATDVVWGGGAQFRDGGAPIGVLARRAMSRLSWVRARSVPLASDSGNWSVDSTRGDIPGSPWQPS
jgi:hypothetical protein